MMTLSRPLSGVESEYRSRTKPTTLNGNANIWICRTLKCIIKWNFLKFGNNAKNKVDNGNCWIIISNIS